MPGELGSAIIHLWSPCFTSGTGSLQAGWSLCCPFASESANIKMIGHTYNFALISYDSACTFCRNGYISSRWILGLPAGCSNPVEPGRGGG